MACNFSFSVLHILLWLAYRAIARPTRSEYLARINEENRLKHEIQQLTQALALEKQNTVTLVAQAQQQAKAKPAARQQAEKLQIQLTNIRWHSIFSFMTLNSY